MNRRNFIKGSVKLLAAIPLLGFLKPEAVTEEPVELPTEITYDWVEPSSFEGLAVWNGEAWAQLDPNGSLTIKGDFLEEDLIKVRQRHYDYYRLTWNGESFSTLK